MQTLHFRVAETLFSVSGTDREALKRLMPSYAPFYVKEADSRNAAPHFTVRVDLLGESTPALVDTLPEGEEVGTFDSQDTTHGVWRLPDGGYKITVIAPDGGLSAAMRATCGFRSVEVTLYGTPEQQQHGLGNCLMISFAFSTAAEGILLMHSSVTMNDGFAYLFLGTSGTGKSTHSRLWHEYIPGSDLLNDDNPAVRCYPDGRCTAFGTPWSGKTPCYRNLALPVGGFVQLKQAPKNRIEREPIIKAYADILASSSMMIWDKPSYAAILHNVETVISRIPVFHLQCLPNAEAARMSHDALLAAQPSSAKN